VIGTNHPFRASGVQRAARRTSARHISLSHLSLPSAMSSPTQYVTKKEVAASYRPKSYVSLPPERMLDIRISSLCSALPLRHTVRWFRSRPLKCAILNGFQQMSPGLLRARAPFRARNAITGVTIAVLVVGVWAYSIAAVKQDSFADVDEEARILAASGSTHGIRSIEDEEKAKAITIPPIHTSTLVGTSTVQPHPPATVTPVVAPLPGLVPRPRGVLSPLLERLYPRLLDPTNRTLVWGAPPVDRVGQLRDQTGRPTSGV
jgi:cytochrome c oxidase assembly factor 3